MVNSYYRLCWKNHIFFTVVEIDLLSARRATCSRTGSGSWWLSSGGAQTGRIPISLAWSDHAEVLLLFDLTCTCIGLLKILIRFPQLHSLMTSVMCLVQKLWISQEICTSRCYQLLVYCEVRFPRGKGWEFCKQLMSGLAAALPSR